MKKRTHIDFSQHELIITVNEDVTTHYLKLKDTICNSVKFINTNGIMVATGDFGNWMFCRHFFPDKEPVDDRYWGEKLKRFSTQEFEEFNPELTKKALLEKIEEYKNENMVEVEDFNEVIQYYLDCIDICDNSADEFEYINFAYNNRPPELDYDEIIIEKDYKFLLKTVFDAFDEIYTRLKK